MSLLPFLLVILAVRVNLTASHTCQALNGVDVILYDKNGNKFNQVITGCIQKAVFDNTTTVVEAYVKEQNVKNLWRDTVKNMKHLKTVSFVKCESEYVAPIAFRNVPNLRNIAISQCLLKEIGTDIFTFNLVPKLQNLALDNNKINYIEDKSFSNLTELKKIDLRHNQLEVWKQEWFENAAALEIMDCQHNKIRAIPRRAFIELRALRHINFDHNDIMKIHQDAFKEIRSLQYLGLAHNRLTALEVNSFPNTVRIDTFTIHGNYLNSLTNAVLRKLTAVKVTIDYNPWKCECLDRINYWLYIKNGKAVISDDCKRDNVPVCVQASLSSENKSCSDAVDPELTERYIDHLRNLSTPLDPSCAKLN